MRDVIAHMGDQFWRLRIASGTRATVPRVELRVGAALGGGFPALIDEAIAAGWMSCPLDVRGWAEKPCTVAHAQCSAWRRLVAGTVEVWLGACGMMLPIEA